MASCQTKEWADASPIVKLTVTQSSSTGDTATLDWTLQYIADYKAYTNGVGREYTVKIAGDTVKTGTYNIDEITGTKTIASGSKTINKTTATQNISFNVSFYFGVTWSGVRANTLSASGSISVAAKTSYTIKYNANGGSGAPSNQTKWFNTALTLSSTKPTRTGYTFQGWATSASGAVAYASGASYTANSAATLYAVWKAVTYSVKYNANGGSGAPAAQTKTYGVNLTLSSTKPTRTNYTFKGWGTSASATTVSYAAGASYTKNAAITLYAVWELSYVKPRITNLIVSRSDVNGSATDEGTYAKVSFSWACDQTVTSIQIRWKKASSTSWTNSSTITASGTSGTVSTVIGANALSTETTYDVQVSVKDSSTSYETSSVPSAKFIIDILNNGNGMGIGKTSELDGVLDIGFKTRHMGGILNPAIAPGTDIDTVLTPNTYYGSNVTNGGYANLPFTSGTFTLRVESGGPNGQIRQIVTVTNKGSVQTWERAYYSETWGGWIRTGYNKQDTLWSGALYMQESQSVTLSQNISDQENGIVLVFSYYTDGAAANQEFFTHFIPKKFVALHAGKGVSIPLLSPWGNCLKYIYVSDASLAGHANNNNEALTVGGITYNNRRFVLRYVIGV